MYYKKLLPDIINYVNKNHEKIIGKHGDFKVSFLAQGEYNINYTIESDFKQVLRINTGSQLNLDNQIEYEFNALKVLESTGVTPIPYYLDSTMSDIPHGLLTMEYLEGEPLSYEHDLPTAASIFSTIHSLDTTNLNNFIVEENSIEARLRECKHWLDNSLYSDSLTDRQKDFFKKIYDIACSQVDSGKYLLDNPRHVINNTEVNSSNFIIGESAYLIDWEKPVIADPSQDITQFLAPTTTLWKTDTILSQSQIDEFYEVYTSQNPKLKDIEKRVNIYKPYLLLRALTWCAYAYVEYQKPDKKIVNQDTLERLIMYLDVDFMRDLYNKLGGAWKI